MIRKTILFIAILICSLNVNGQYLLSTDFYESNELDIQPKLMVNDSLVDVKNFVKQNIRWLDGMYEGERIFLSCIVDTNGHVGTIELLKIPEMCDLCTIETVRVVSSLPQFTPGYKNGRKVNAKITIWIRFGF
ncbi:MAG: energy transducer TonB [Crocinitomicaceae bacterium]|nr:energy transducer TonB [Crocinitomicaceae bacterium]